MVMVADSMPGLKRWLAPLGLKESVKLLVIRMVVSFVLHAGRMSCLRRRGGPLRAAASRPDQPLPGAATVAEARHQLDPAAGPLGARGRRRPVLLPHRCHPGQSGRQEHREHLQHRQPQAAALQGAAHGKNKHAVKNCHSFTMGPLITPSGLRIPFGKPYHTQEYCKAHGLVHRTTAEAAADLIRELPVPEGRV